VLLSLLQEKEGESYSCAGRSVLYSRLLLVGLSVICQICPRSHRAHRAEACSCSVVLGVVPTELYLTGPFCLPCL